MRNSFWLFLFLGSLSTVLLGQIDISERLKLLREKSKRHQSYIDSLIGGRSINKTATKVESKKPSSNLSGNSYGIDSPVQNAAELPKVTFRIRYSAILIAHLMRVSMKFLLTHLHRFKLRKTN